MAVKVFIAIPNMGWLHDELIDRLIPWLRDWDTILWKPSYVRPISEARDNCVVAMRQSSATHLWFIDADTAPDSNALELLLRANVAAISGVVHQLKRDTDGELKRVGMVMRRNGDGDLKAAYGTGVERIDSCGSGCVLFERQVFERLEMPWYEGYRSDFRLCEKLVAVEIPLYAHFGVVCKHRKEIDL